MDKFVFNYIYTQVTLSYKREKKKRERKRETTAAELQFIF